MGLKRLSEIAFTRAVDPPPPTRLVPSALEIMSPSPTPVTKNLATAPRYVSSRLLFLAELNFPSFQSSEPDQFPSVFLKKGLKACLHWKVYLAYPASLQGTPLKYLETNNSNTT